MLVVGFSQVSKADENEADRRASYDNRCCLVQHCSECAFLLACSGTGQTRYGGGHRTVTVTARDVSAFSTSLLGVGWFLSNE